MSVHQRKAILPVLAAALASKAYQHSQREDVSVSFFQRLFLFFFCHLLLSILEPEAVSNFPAASAIYSFYWHFHLHISPSPIRRMIERQRVQSAAEHKGGIPL